RLGRFLSPDPIIGDPTSSRSWNFYSYVGNNPLSYVDPTGLVQAGPGCPPLSGCMHFGGGGGGGATTRTITVTITVTVHGVMSVPYRYAVPVWTHVWNGDGYAWHVGDEYYWGERSVTQSFSFNVTRTITIPDESVAEEPADMGGLAMTTADVGASILIPGYDLFRCNMEGDCDWTDWVLGIGEIAVSATGVGYGARVLAKAGIKGGAKAVPMIADAANAPQAGQKVYRVYGGKADWDGRSWTPIDPRPVDNFRDAAGLPDVNTGRFVVEGTLKDTRGVTMRSADPLDGNRGGLLEVVVPDARRQIEIERVSGINPEY
ncbi:MAG: hypothetical protein OXH52_12085, partial [Gammaproteobacteria bacterium]|nr:hypothetical protein [Gammaproteobacteria bacterium]